MIKSPQMESSLVASEWISLSTFANRLSVAAGWPAIAPIQCCATVFSAEEYTGRASPDENDETAVWQADPDEDDQGAA